MQNEPSLELKLTMVERRWEGATSDPGYVAEMQRVIDMHHGRKVKRFNPMDATAHTAQRKR